MTTKTTKTKTTKTKTTKAKAFTLADFMTKDLNETATKMPLLFDGKDTGCHLMVKGIESKSVQRDRIVAQIAYADMAEALEKITDKIEKIEFERNERERIEILLASPLVVGWSFGEMDGKQELIELLRQNKGIALGVIAHAATPNNYLLK